MRLGRSTGTSVVEGQTISCAHCILARNYKTFIPFLHGMKEDEEF